MSIDVKVTLDNGQIHNALKNYIRELYPAVGNLYLKELLIHTNDDKVTTAEANFREYVK